MEFLFLLNQKILVIQNEAYLIRRLSVYIDLLQQKTAEVLFEQNSNFYTIITASGKNMNQLSIDNKILHIF